MLDERQGLKDLKTSDIVDVKAAEHGDLVAGADKDAEDTRVVEGGETKEEVVTKEEEEEEEWIEHARCASRQGHGVSSMQRKRKRSVREVTAIATKERHLRNLTMSLPSSPPPSFMFLGSPYHLL
ncbi:hypothetical protein GYH30_027434 [Glycine max]|nr:hypothetical protein GYH30_027434 [Glycine max]